CKIATVFAGIDLDQNLAAGRATTIQVVEKEFPFLGRPTARFVFAPAKRARKGGDQIKLFPEIRQRLECADPVRDALDAEKIDQLVRERVKIDIYADAAVAELFGEKKKKSRAAAKIENLFRRGGTR